MKVIRSGGGGCNDIELPDTVAGANGQDEIVDNLEKCMLLSTIVLELRMRWRS